VCKEEKVMRCQVVIGYFSEWRIDDVTIFSGYFNEWRIAMWRNLVEWRVSGMRGAN